MKIDINHFFIKLFILIILIQGWITAFTNYLNIEQKISYGTISIYLLYLIILFKTILNYKKYSNKFYIQLFFLYALFLFYLTLKLILNKDVSFYSFTRSINYVLPLSLLFYLPTLNNSQIKNSLSFIILVSSIIVFWGLIQFLDFNNWLNYHFKEAPLIDPDIKSYDIIKVFNNFFWKPNGLIGNPLEYSSFLVIIFLAQIAFFKKIKAITLITIIVIFLGLSRFTSVFIVLSLLCYYLNFSRLKIDVKFLNVFLVLVIISILIITFSDKIQDVCIFLINRIFNIEGVSNRSNMVHLENYQTFLSFFYKRPLFGYPIGYFSGQNDIITDGAWIKMMLEFGIVGLFLYLAIIVYIFISVLRKQKYYNKYYFFTFNFLIIYIVLNNLFNSTIFNKSLYNLFWLIISIIIVDYYKKDDDNN